MEVSELVQIIMGSLAAIVVALLNYAVKRFVLYLDQKGVVDAIESKHYLVQVAVGAVQQIYSEEGGPAKKEEAMKRALKLLNDNGLTVTAEELDSFLEESVLAIKEGANSALNQEKLAEDIEKLAEDISKEV